MNRQYTHDKLLTIMEQAMIYQCACPSLVTKIASDLQHLYDYQLTCMNNTSNDAEIHSLIAEAATKAYIVIEDCLTRILTLEGWDMNTLKMPDYLIKQQINELENGIMPPACGLPAAQRRQLS